MQRNNFMELRNPAGPPDYLIIGHVARDLTPQGTRLGGTAAYAGLTAARLGLRVAVLTAATADLELDELSALAIERQPADENTTFENRYASDGRRQRLLARAADLDPEQIPPDWRGARIVHLAPIAAEVPPAFIERFPQALIGLTAQGLMRSWDDGGIIKRNPAGLTTPVAQSAGVVMISIEDADGDQDWIARLAPACRLLVVTEGAGGARVTWRGKTRHFPAPTIPEIDPTGSGDIFAAAYLVRLYQTRDPWEAARFAIRLASASITRQGLDGIPTDNEIMAAATEASG